MTGGNEQAKQVICQIIARRSAVGRQAAPIQGISRSVSG